MGASGVLLLFGESNHTRDDDEVVLLSQGQQAHTLLVAHGDAGGVVVHRYGVDNLDLATLKARDGKGESPAPINTISNE